MHLVDDSLPLFVVCTVSVEFLHETYTSENPRKKIENRVRTRECIVGVLIISIYLLDRSSTGAGEIFFSNAGLFVPNSNMSRSDKLAKLLKKRTYEKPNKSVSRSNTEEQ